MAILHGKQGLLCDKIVTKYSFCHVTVLQIIKEVANQKSLVINSTMVDRTRVCGYADKKFCSTVYRKPEDPREPAAIPTSTNSGNSIVFFF